MDHPLAYFLTWTTYGTRLHGDARGSVDPAHNAVNSPLLPENAAREAGRRAKMNHPDFVMTDEQRAVVDATVRDHAAFRGWCLHAINVRTNHVHVVVDACGVEPEVMLREFKSWATRRMRERGLVSPLRRLWTDHGSTRYLWTFPEIGPAVVYVRDRQD
jgi:REP element-mobilizing transposase RayT